MIIVNCTLEKLSAELREFEADHNLDQASADERSRRRLPPGQSRWMRDFEWRWDTATVLAPLAVTALATDDDDEKYDANYNAFTDALFPYMTNSQRRKWDDLTLTVTPAVMIVEALRILGIPAPEWKADLNKEIQRMSVRDIESTILTALRVAAEEFAEAKELQTSVKDLTRRLEDGTLQIEHGRLCRERRCKKLAAATAILRSGLSEAAEVWDRLAVDPECIAVEQYRFKRQAADARSVLTQIEGMTLSIVSADSEEG